MTQSDLQAMGLDELLDLARSRFPIRFEPLSVDGVSLDILQIEDMPDYVDHLAAQAGDGELELPFWAKIWPAAIITAYFLRRLPVQDKQPMLELGAGVGVAGLFAAEAGHRMVLTDIHPDALLFSRINVLKNGLEDRVEVFFTDFTTTRLDRRFTRILGCEILYQDEVYRPLIKFLGRHLDTGRGAEVILAKDFRRKAKKFFKLAEPEYRWEEKVIGFKSHEQEQGDEERHLCAIYRLVSRKTRA